jgi:hypothetical protein
MTSRQLAGLALAPPVQPDAGEWGNGVRIAIGTVTFASQTSGTTIPIVTLPKGSRVLKIECVASATHGGSATIAIGIAGTTALFRAAAILTAVGSSIVSTAAAYATAAGGPSAPFAADTTIILTTGAASLPSSGTANYIVYYTTSH